MVDLLPAEVPGVQRHHDVPGVRVGELARVDLDAVRGLDPGVERQAAEMAKQLGLPHPALADDQQLRHPLLRQCARPGPEEGEHGLGAVAHDLRRREAEVVPLELECVQVRAVPELGRQLRELVPLEVEDLELGQLTYLGRQLPHVLAAEVQVRGLPPLRFGDSVSQSRILHGATTVTRSWAGLISGTS
jgi:hypothetical protein